MSTYTIRTGFWMLSAAAITVLGIGCASRGYDLADKTGAGIAKFRDEVVEVKKSVDATLLNLSKVTQEAHTNPRKSFEQFSSSVDSAEKAAAAAKSQAQSMQAQGQAYFAKWEQELASLKNEEVRKLALDRKAKLQETFGNIKTVMQKAKDEFQPFLDDAKSLRGFLGLDLTEEGIASAKDLIQKTSAEGAKVQQTLEAAIAELNAVNALLTPAKAKKGGTPTPPPAPGAPPAPAAAAPPAGA